MSDTPVCHKGEKPENAEKGQRSTPELGASVIITHTLDPTMMDTSPEADTIHTERELAKEKECSPCAKLLQAILSDPGSKPRRFVQAMFQESGLESPSLKVEPLSEGMRVHVPVQSTLNENRSNNTVPLQNSWSERLGLTVPSSAAVSFLNSPTLATSAVKVNENSSSQQEENEQQQQTEWLTVTCRDCKSTGPEAGARAFVQGPSPLSIVICQNRISTSSPLLFPIIGASQNSREQEMAEMLSHEFSHIYDVRQLRLDLQTCQGLAYSEIRAAKNAECANKRGKGRQYHQCVRQTATGATGNLFPLEEARKCIRGVWEHAIRDDRPFKKPTTGMPSLQKRESSSYRTAPCSSR